MKSFRFLPLCVFITSVLSAQPRSLSIEESIALGIEYSKALHASQMKMQFADAKSSEVAAALYPSLKLQAGYLKVSEVPAFRLSTFEFPVILDNYSTKLALQQPLFTGWRLQGAADNAEYTANAVHTDYEKDKADLLYNIKAAYWNVYRAQEFKQLADENVQQLSAHLSDVENLSKQGMATTNEVLKVQVQLANARVLQSDAANSLRIAVMSLNSTIGLPLNTEIAIASPLTPTTKEFPDVDQLLSKALDQRPDVRGMDWRIKAVEAGFTAARFVWLPQVMLTGNYYYSRPNPRFFPAQDEFKQFKDTWDVGVSLQFDIWNNLTTVHQTTQASAQLEQTKDAMAMLRDGVTLEVTQSYLSFQQAKEKIRLAQLSVRQADENLRVTKEKFKAGVTTNSELLDAEVAQLQAKIQLTQALVEYELAEAKLEKAVGDLK